MHRNYKLSLIYFRTLQLKVKEIKQMQHYAEIYLLLNYSKYFGRPLRASSGVHKNVVAVSVRNMYSSIAVKKYLLQPRITTNGTTNIKFVHKV